MSQNATFNQPWSFFVVSIDRSPVHPQHNGRVFSDGRPLSLYLIIINEAEDVVFRLMDVQYYVMNVGWIVAEHFAQPTAEPLPQLSIEIDGCFHFLYFC